jgi:1,4-alpha-glucan branching enzyme
VSSMMKVVTPVKSAAVEHSGMGAVSYRGGITFRVWAPHADRVFVVGEFNAWSKTANPLAEDGDGYWSADVPDAKAGQQYKFVIHNGDQELFRNDPYAREVTQSNGNSIVHKPEFDWGDDHYAMPAWNLLVIYELHIGTFNRKTKDSLGTFESAIDRLAYLKDLGINAIEIMPPMEFPGSQSWGYNPNHPFALESDYGGAGPFKRLVKAAHEHGIAVILDVVYNHFGPGDLDLWQFDGWSENGKGGIYFYNDERAATPWGETRPDYGRREVRQYIRDNAMMWLDEYHVDGLRFDSTAFIRNIIGENDPAYDLPDGWSMMTWIHEEIQARAPSKITIAEDIRNNEWVTKDIGAGGLGFGAQWDGDFAGIVRAAVISPDDAARSVDAIRQALSHRFNDDAFQRVIYTESHDEVADGKKRVPEEIWPGQVGNWFSKKRSDLGAALVFTAPGIPMILQGQEFLEDRWFADTDPLDWSRVEVFHGNVDMYRRLIWLRRNMDGVTAGLSGQHSNVHHVNNDNKMIAFHRWYDAGGPGDDVVVVANFANRADENYNIGFPRAGLWRVRFNSDWNGYDPQFSNHLSVDTEAVAGEKDGMPFNGNVSIGPYSVVIFSQEP